MTKGLYIIFSILLLLNCVSAQDGICKMKWRNLIYDQTDQWYATEEARQVAENVLLYQRNNGGWPKNTAMHLPLSDEKLANLRTLKESGKGATIDNGATTQELDFLSRIYAQTKDPKYKKAFLQGLKYLLDAQYQNGGWPQIYPLEVGEYSTHITYNDNAMVNVMLVMKDIWKKSGRFSIDFDQKWIQKAEVAFNKGVGIILKTQYKQNGTLTVWCAQHDETTLLPAKARSYELPSLSGSESVQIVLLLMEIENPSREIINAVQAAVNWFDKVKIENIRIEKAKNKDGIRDVRVIKDLDASPVWARFYDLKTNRPFFCDRDGVKKYSLSEIGHERRNGYSWYVDGARDIFKRYKKWQPQWAPKQNVININ